MHNEGIGNICMHTKLNVNSYNKDYACEEPKKHINHALCTIMSHLNVWKASNILALKFLQIIYGMNVLHAARGRKASILCI